MLAIKELGVGIHMDHRFIAWATVYRSVRYVLVVLAFGWWTTVQALQISITPPGEGARFLDLDNYNVQLSGNIENGDASRLEVKLRPLVADGRVFSFYLNSPGGSLIEGMKIGRVIRKYGLVTYVGQNRKEDEKSLPGHCLSACALSFLGGSYRFVENGSIYGVHRFYNNRSPSSQDMDMAQIISAAVSSYIREMGVEAELFDQMTFAGKDDMNIIPPKKLKELNVANGGRLPAKWTIEVVTGSTYLRGEQMTIWGKGRAMFICGNKGMVMQSIVPVGDKAKSMISGKWFHSLLIDEDTVPIPNPLGMRSDDGFLLSLIPLTSVQVKALAKAKSIGQAIQLSRDDFRFVGYHIEISKLDKERVSTFLMNCISSQ
jgi:hypothetical protein